MASSSSSSANNCLSSFFLLLLTLILSSSLLHTAHSRDSQFFNKVSATTNNNNLVPQTKQLPPQNNNFIPDKENGYGLSDHVSGQLPPSATTEESDQLPLHNKYLPKNYNPVAYVTQPEIDDKTTFSSSNPYDDNNNYYYNNGGAKNYYKNKQEFEQESGPYRNYPTGRNNNYYYYNDDPQGRLSDSTGGFRGGPTFSNYRQEKYLNNDLFEPQGMSDTRLLENGKYFYDVNTERYSSSHPYERLRRARNGFNDANINSGINNAYEFDNLGNGGYQNQEDQFPDEGINDLP